MRCRKLDKNNVVWYGSAGIKQEDKAVFSYYKISNNIIIKNRIIEFELDSRATSQAIQYKNKYGERLAINLAEPSGQVAVVFKNSFPIIFKIDTSKGINGFDNLLQKIYLINENVNIIAEVQLLNSKINPEKDENEKNINYSENQRGVKDSLIQRTSIIKGELWYRASYGLPVFEKVRNKGITDAVLIDIILAQPDIKSLISFSSAINQKSHLYTATYSVLSIYGDEEIILNYANIS